MKKFLKIFIYFFIPIVIASACLEVYMRHIPNSYTYKDEWMKKNGNSVETLILGSSHAYYGINPEYLSSKAFNLANVSEDLERDKFVLYKYAEQEKNLKNVILVLSDDNLLSNMDISVENWRIAYYSMYMGYNKKPLALEITNARMADKLTAYLRGEDMRGCNRLGFGTAYTKSNRITITSNIINETLKRHTVLNKEGAVDTTRLADNIDFLDDIIHLCKQKSIKLIIIQPPVVKEYWELMNKKQLSIFYQTIRTEVAKNRNIEFHNYSCDTRLTLDDFYDCDHLTMDGARKFSEILNAEIITSL
jgi:hypothetical protein